MEYTKDREVLSLEEEHLRKLSENHCHSDSDTRLMHRRYKIGLWG